MSKVIYQTLVPQNAVILNVEFNYTEIKDSIKKLRRVRYVEGMDEIFVDEQNKINPNAEKTPVMMINGRLDFDNNQKPNLEKVLDLSPQNEMSKNSGTKIFKKVILDDIETFEIEIFEKKLDVQDSLRKESNRTLNRLIAVRYLSPKYISRDFTNSTIKLVLLRKTETDKKFTETLYSFIKSKDSNDVKSELMVITALSENILSIEGGKKMTWSGSDELLFMGTESKDAIKEFSLYLSQNKEGRLLSQQIAQKIKKIKK